MNKVEILDCTLRDGSYVIDNHFSKSDTSVISSILFNAGINYVEVGHGLGLGANSKKYGTSFCTDEEYISSAKASKINNKNKVGVFCFPFIANKKIIIKAKKSGLDFIRVGVDLQNIAKSKEIIKFSKRIGLEVFANLVKTYSLPPKAVANKAKQLEKFGADVICLVDSAGAMLPDEIKKYFKETKKSLNKRTKLNFHGHNNLGFANSNCIHAIEAGANIVDTSVMGMGRSAGNAVTEMMIPVLQRKKLISNKINLKLILNLAKNIVSNLNPKKEFEPESILYGKSYFHSGFKHKLKDFAKKNKISFYDILDKNSFRKVLNVDSNILKKKYFSIKRNKKYPKAINYPNIPYSSGKEFNNLSNFKKYLLSEQKRKKSEVAITICRSRTKNINFKAIHYYMDHHIAHIESPDKICDLRIIKEFKDNQIFFDEKILNKKRADIIKNLNYYSEKKIYNEAKNLFFKSNDKYNKFILSKKINIKKINKSNNILIVAKTLNFKVLNFIKQIKKPFDLMVYNNLKLSIQKVKKSNNFLKKIFKLNYGFVLTIEIIKQLQLRKYYRNFLGERSINSKLSIISGGIIGEKNSIVVDNVFKPSRIIGLADGYGSLSNKKISFQNQMLLSQLILEQQNDI